MPSNANKGPPPLTCPYLRHENSNTDSLRIAARILLFIIIVLFAEYLTFSGLAATWLQGALAQPACSGRCGNGGELKRIGAGDTAVHQRMISGVEQPGTELIVPAQAIGGDEALFIGTGDRSAGSWIRP